jgi:methionine sulfoxide reductase catalytic subunit
MLIRTPARWTLPERYATTEGAYFGRRRFLQGLAAGGIAIAARPLLGGAPPLTDPRAAFYPAKRNERYKLDRKLSDAAVAAKTNIFDEFALSHDAIWSAAKDFVTAPWPIHIGGTVKKQKKVDVDDLVRQLGIEERLYRHRCVEAWAMAVPWSGIPLRKLIDFAEPLSTARFLRMVSFSCPEMAPGWYASRRVFPYYEALTLAEATNELSFLATGIYGHPLPPQHGAPLRLVVPWKYGFKSIKSIASFQFTAERPGTFWNDLSPTKYSFSSNVDPTETNPWPQNEETMIGTREKRPTLQYNGYGEFVASLYS